LGTLGYDKGKTIPYNFIRENFKRHQGSFKSLSRHLYFPTKVSLILSQSPSKLTVAEKEVVETLCSAVPDIKRACILSRQFRNLLTFKRGRLTKRFEIWLERAGKCNIWEIRSFAKGLWPTLTRVHNAILLKLSNGQVEGQINKLKTVKRQMYGRASFDLLKHRLLLLED